MNESTGGKLVENPNATLLQNIIKHGHGKGMKLRKLTWTNIQY